MTVSVLIITYNQEQFIRQAIDSALQQQTSFGVEILVGDDFSTDSTRAIIQEYERTYPDRVFGVLHPRNLGKNGGINFLETLKRATGTYYALMDGDDYWTDPLKLQKQVDFLEARPDYSMVFHNALITYEDGTPAHVLNGPDTKPFFTLDDLIGEKEIWFMATSSTLYRNSIREYPAWFHASVSGDIPRLVLKAKQGKIGYLPDVMSVYRKNGGGTSFTDKYDDAVFLRNRIAMYEGMNRELEGRYAEPLRQTIAGYYRFMLDSKQYRDRLLPRLGVVATYLKLARLTPDERTEIIQKYAVPAPLMRLYSTVAIGLNKLLQG